MSGPWRLPDDWNTKGFGGVGSYVGDDPRHVAQEKARSLAKAAGVDMFDSGLLAILADSDPDRIVASAERAYAPQAILDRERLAAERQSVSSAFDSAPALTGAEAIEIEDYDPETDESRWLSSADFLAKYPKSRIVGNVVRMACGGFAFATRTA